MAFSLGSLAPNILSLLTRYIPLEDLISLRLCGDSAFWNRLSQHGGVTDLLVTTKKSFAIYMFDRPLLSTFRHLSELIIEADTLKNPTSWCFTEDLPPTMRVIRCKLMWNRFLFLRQVPEFSDDTPDALSVLMPINMAEKFPDLHTLHWHEANRENWTKQKLTYFFHHLPTSLTSLQVHWLHNYLSFEVSESNTPDPSIPTPVLPLNKHDLLQTFEWLNDVPTVPLELISTIVPDNTLPIPVIPSLTSLRIDPIKENDLAGFLQHLSTLKHLHIRFSARSLAGLTLPGGLESFILNLTVGDGDSGDLLSQLLLRVPKLLTFKLHMDDEDPIYDLTNLPPHLTELSVSSLVKISQELPISLTKLSIMPVLPSPYLSSLEPLKSLTFLACSADMLFWAEDKAFRLPLPPSLRELRILDLVHDINRLGILPKHLQVFSATVEINDSSMGLIHPAPAIFTPQALQQRIQQLYFPQMNPSECVITSQLHAQVLGFLSSVSREQVKEFGGYSAPELAPLASVWSGEWPSSFTSLNLSSISLRRLRVAHFSPNLATLILPKSVDYSASIIESVPSPTTAAHALPRKLTVFETPAFMAPASTKDEQGNIKRGDTLYPFFETAPRLTTLTLHLNLTDSKTYLLHSLPTTITDLTIGCHIAIYGVRTIMEPPKEWLPNLHRLSVSRWWFPIRSILPRASTLDKLDLSHVIVHADIIPAFDPVTFTKSESFVIWRHLVTHLAPPHLRKLDIEFSVEWNQQTLQLLPDTLTTLKDVYENKNCFNKSPPFDLILPRSVTHLELNAGPTFLITLALPNTLRTVSLDLRPWSATMMNGALQSLPSSLTALRLLYQGYLTAEQYAFLPSSLRRLSLSSFSSSSNLIDPDIYVKNFDGLPSLQLLNFCVALRGDPAAPYAFYRCFPKTLTALRVVYRQEPSTAELEAVRQTLPGLKLFASGRHVYDFSADIDAGFNSSDS